MLIDETFDALAPEGVEGFLVLEEVGWEARFLEPAADVGGTLAEVDDCGARGVSWLVEESDRLEKNLLCSPPPGGFPALAPEEGCPCG